MIPATRCPTCAPPCSTAAGRRCGGGATGERATLRVVADAGTTTEHVEREAVSTSTHADVLAAVRSLPYRQRDVILLRHWLGLSESEIADTLGVSTGTVKSAASRARTTLATALEPLR